MLLAAVTGYDESMVSAVAALTQAVEAADDPALQLQGRLLLTPAIGLTGRMKESVDHARTAVAEAERLGAAGLRSQALTMWVLVSFMYGLGFDGQAMQTALDLEESNERGGRHLSGQRGRGCHGGLDRRAGQRPRADAECAAAFSAGRHGDRHSVGGQPPDDDRPLARSLRRGRRDSRRCRATSRANGRQAHADQLVGMSGRGCSSRRSRG